jgi:uncharacterized protein with HEPN domain
MKTDQIYLRHILDAIEKIDSYVSVGRDVFMTTFIGRMQQAGSLK